MRTDDEVEDSVAGWSTKMVSNALWTVRPEHVNCWDAFFRMSPISEVAAPCEFKPELKGEGMLSSAMQRIYTSGEETYALTIGK